MTARRPRLLRWTEEAEGEQVCALAGLEREPPSASPDPVTFVPPPPLRHRSAVLPWLLSWFGGSGAQNHQSRQIKRDDH
jgi:hypothetical protein